MDNSLHEEQTIIVVISTFKIEQAYFNTCFAWQAKHVGGLFTLFVEISRPNSNYNTFYKKMTLKQNNKCQ